MWGCPSLAKVFTEHRRRRFYGRRPVDGHQRRGAFHAVESGAGRPAGAGLFGAGLARVGGAAGVDLHLQPRLRGHAAVVHRHRLRRRGRLLRRPRLPHGVRPPFPSRWPVPSAILDSFYLKNGVARHECRNDVDCVHKLGGLHFTFGRGGVSASTAVVVFIGGPSKIKKNSLLCSFHDRVVLFLERRQRPTTTPYEPLDATPTTADHVS